MSRLGVSVRRLKQPLLAASVMLASASAFSASPAPYQQALDAVLNDVSNPSTSFRFVQVATASGDLRGAAAALERMLLLNPKLANIQLELGIIYYRLGNPELGRYHIAEALRAPNVPFTVRARAEQYLAAASAVTRRHFVRGRISAGTRYEDNANAGTDADTVRVPGAIDGSLADVPLEGASGRSDTSLEVSAAISHSYAFSTRAGTSWDSDLLVFANRYDDLDDLDFASVRVDSGPSVSLGPQPDRGLQVRPFMTAAYAWLDEDDYFENWGGGVDLRYFHDNRSITSTRLLYQDQTFEDSSTRTLSDRSGDYVTLDLMHVWQLGRAQWSAGVMGESVDADAGHWSFDRYGASAGLRMFFGHGGVRAPWSVSTMLSWRETDYDSSNPVIEPDRVRNDTRFDARLGVEVPVTRRAALTLAGFYADNQSNIALYEFDNSGLVAGLYVRF